MLQPKKLEWNKQRKYRIRGYASRKNSVDFGSFGFMALDSCRINARQIEAVRRVLSRATKRTGKTWIRIFPHTPVSQKPAEVRMGSGKGSVSYYVARVRPGTVMFEIEAVSLELAKQLASVVGAKLPTKVKLVSKREIF